MDKDILRVQTGVEYPIYFRHSYDGLRDAFLENGLLAEMPEMSETTKTSEMSKIPEISLKEGFGYKKLRKILIITDSNVAPLYLDTVTKALTGFSLANSPLADSLPAFIFEAGESSKNMNTLQDIYNFFLANKLDRRSVVVALGGGVTGDMAGYAAATYMRGLDYVQLPTSLLAQVDSSVGGKTAVDFQNVKNLIGSFHQPRLVYINLSTLKTLPKDEFTSGMGEVIKHGLIGGRDYGGGYYEYLHKNRQAIQNLIPEVIQEVVAGSCRIKAAVVAQDEKETGLRETLNFGHCVGHAIESLSNYTISHGHCVVIGMCAALQLSQKLGHITLQEVERALKLIRDFELPTGVREYINQATFSESIFSGSTFTGSTFSESTFSVEAIIATMFKDKKTINDTLRVVLLKKIGYAYTDSTVPIEMIEECIGR